MRFSAAAHQNFLNRRQRTIWGWLPLMASLDCVFRV